MRSITVVCLIFVSAANANLVEESKSYLCCGKPELTVDAGENCEQSWESAKENIAEYHPVHPLECSAPCRKVSSGKLVMDTCLNVTLKMVCPDGHLTLDKITKYTPHMDKCPVTPEAFVKSAASPRNRYYGLVPSSLLCFFALICLGINSYCAR